VNIPYPPDKQRVTNLGSQVDASIGHPFQRTNRYHSFSSLSYRLAMRASTSQSMEVSKFSTSFNCDVDTPSGGRARKRLCTRRVEMVFGRSLFAGPWVIHLMRYEKESAGRRVASFFFMSWITPTALHLSLPGAVPFLRCSPISTVSPICYPADRGECHDLC
jgi:hypothetical protein